MILQEPVARTLLQLVAPNIIVMLIQAVMGAVDAAYPGWLGLDAPAGVALVFPILMSAMSAAGLGGVIVGVAGRFSSCERATAPGH